MNITGKYVKDGTLLGFEITEENTYSAPPMSLYLEPYMQVLTQNGYCYYDYEPSHITLPNGQSIMTVPDKEYTDEVRAEIALARRSFSNILSDAQACKYYTQKVEQGPAVEFIKYPGPFEINTREELEEYVTNAERTLLKNPCGIMLRPWNTLVNPDIWFTPDEILVTNAGTLYQRLMSLRKWANYEHYMLTCNFLAEQGVMQPGDYSLRGLMQGWYAYGPELIKGRYTRTGFALNASGNFYNNDTCVATKDCSENAVHRLFTIGAYNTRTGTIHAATGESADADGTLSFDRGRRQSVWVHDPVLNKLKTAETSYDVLVIPAIGVDDCSDRFACTVEHDGRLFETRYDHSRCYISYEQSEKKQRKSMSVPMMIGTAIRGDYIPIWRIHSEDDYKKYLMAQLYSIVHSQRMMESPISATNTTYLEQLHMGIIGRINKSCKMTDESSFRLELVKEWDFTDTLGKALKMYIDPIPAYILDIFDIPEANTKEEFLAQADIDNYVSRLIGESSEDGDATVPTYIPKGLSKGDALRKVQMLQQQGYTYEPYNYYQLVRLVHTIIQGNSAYGCLAEGLRQDASLKIDTATNALLAIVNAVKGADCSIGEFTDVIESLGSYVNLNTIYRPRDAAAVGYVRDFARDVDLMYNKNTPMWTYVSRVYRELSNKPVEEQRPYLLELISFSMENAQDKAVREVFYQLAELALEGKNIVPEYNYEKLYDCEENMITSGEKLTKCFTGYIACNLLFKCLIGVKSGRLNPETDYTETFTFFDEHPVTVTVPAFALKTLVGLNLDARRKYITVEQYCTLEVSPIDEKGRSRIVCVNAEITPWSVTPLKGFMIKSYPLLQNYYDAEVLQNSFGAEKTTALIQSNIKVATSLKQSCSDMDNFICPLTGIKKEDDSLLQLHNTIIKTATSYDDLDCLMSTDFAETVDAYVKRWTLAKAQAKSMGKTLLSIPLKQDFLYGEIATILGFDSCNYPVFVDDDSIKGNFLAEDVLVLGARKELRIAESRTERLTLSPLSVENIDEAIAAKIAELSEMDILPVVEYYGRVVSAEGIVSREWLRDNFIKVGDKKYVGRLQTGYYVIEEA